MGRSEKEFKRVGRESRKHTLQMWSVVPVSRPWHKEQTEITRTRVGTSLPEAGQALDYQRGGGCLSAPNPLLISTQKTAPGTLLGLSKVGPSEAKPPY